MFGTTKNSFTYFLCMWTVKATPHGCPMSVAKSGPAWMTFVPSSFVAEASVGYFIPLAYWLISAVIFCDSGIFMPVCHVMEYNFQMCITINSDIINELLDVILFSLFIVMSLFWGRLSETALLRLHHFCMCAEYCWRDNLKVHGHGQTHSHNLCMS